MATTKKIMGAIAAIVLVVSVTMGSFAFKANDTNNPTKLATHYFIWNPSNNEYDEVDEADAPDCQGGSLKCGATSTLIDANGQPSGQVRFLTKP